MISSFCKRECSESSGPIGQAGSLFDAKRFPRRTACCQQGVNATPCWHELEVPPLPAGHFLPPLHLLLALSARQPNAGPEPLPEAGATEERTLEAVGSRPSVRPGRAIFLLAASALQVYYWPFSVCSKLFYLHHHRHCRKPFPLFHHQATPISL